MCGVFLVIYTLKTMGLINNMGIKICILKKKLRLKLLNCIKFILKTQRN